MTENYMNTGPTFEEYLRSKKIDSDLFKREEPGIWESWKREFDQVHPNSFTVQKLNLINPVRRKYLLQTQPTENKPVEQAPVVQPVARPGRPVIRPKRD